ncbi:MAG: LLM class F420-dependent oxidoreductase [Deltaproteobacteria bacterium]|nr:LLM class F420-dependent oxidoreductase [Deltaproteobacteria bacterium]MBW2359465.1 LLM class F420-dependent oxidoreductase [Deltaproteobacteria bacterium]
MRLGIIAGQFGPKMQVPFETIEEADRLGYHSVWTAEAYGNDAIVPLTFIAARTTNIKLGTAIMQMPARTPAMTAMTAQTLDLMSGGRFILGLGPSGPQVVEGWHGVPYGRPLTRTREYVSIVRKILAREARLEHEGYHYEIPFMGEGASGLGKPLKSILHGRPDIEIYTAAISPNGLRCSGEVADGVMPVWMSPDQPETIFGSVREGIAKAEGGKSLEDFDVAPFVSVVLADDIEKARMPIKVGLALYIGGMGARDKNFYNDYAKRLGYEAAAKQIQDLYLDGKRAEAVAAVPDELVDEMHLVGPKERIAERFERWKASPVKTMLLGTGQPEVVRLMAELAG